MNGIVGFKKIPPPYTGNEVEISKENIDEFLEYYKINPSNYEIERSEVIYSTSPTNYEVQNKMRAIAIKIRCISAVDNNYDIFLHTQYISKFEDRIENFQTSLIKYNTVLNLVVWKKEYFVSYSQNYFNRK